MKLGIYGTGGTGHEIFEMASLINDKNQRWDEIVFIDDTKPSQELRGCKQMPFEECTKQYDSKELEIVIAVGEPSSKYKIRQKVKEQGYHLATVIHPDSYISESATLGEGVVVKMQSIIFANAVLEENVFVQANVIVGHDVKVGADCQISAFAHICGNVTIGEQTFIGAQSGIREKLSIGDSCILAMGAMVMSDMVSNATAVGNPAKIIKRKEDSRVF